jgi:hypothetical protein
MRNILAFLLLAFAIPVTAQQAQYSVWDGHNLRPLSNTQGIVCDHWAIWLYTDATTDPKPAKGWGEVDGASAGEVQEKYQKLRDNMEHLLASNHTGYEVHLGPVAVIEPPPQADNPQFSSASKKTDDLYDRIVKDFDLANKLIDTCRKNINQPLQGYYYQQPLQGADAGDNLDQGKQDELQGYLKGLHDTMEKANELRHRLNDIDGPALMDIQRQLDAINADLTTTESDGQKLAKKLQSNNHADDSSDWLGQVGYEKSGSGVSTKVTAFDGLQTGFVVTVVANGGFENYTVHYREVSSVKTAYQNNQVQLGLTVVPYSIYVSFPTPEQAQHFLQFVQRHTGNNR